MSDRCPARRFFTAHRFIAAYDSFIPPGFSAEYAPVAMMDAIKTRIYRGHVCRFCGAIRHADPKGKS